MFEKIQKWYKQGLWTEEMVKNARLKGVLTFIEYTEIINGHEENK